MFKHYLMVNNSSKESYHHKISTIVISMLSISKVVESILFIHPQIANSVSIKKISANYINNNILEKVRHQTLIYIHKSLIILKKHLHPSQIKFLIFIQKLSKERTLKWPKQDVPIVPAKQY
jgi:hypothetical protein